MAGLDAILNLSLFSGLIYILAGVISIPPTASALEKKINFNASGAARFIAVFVLLMTAAATAPHVDTVTSVNNSTNAIAAPLSSDSGSDAIAVPSKPTSTLTPDNKEKLDIITSPAGATVTVDGVSQGLSPVNGLSVDARTHTVDLYLLGYNAKTLIIDTTNSDTKTLSWEFTPLENPSPTHATTETTADETDTTTDKTTATTTDKTATTADKTTADKTTTTTDETTATTDETTVTNTGGTLYASSESNKYHSAGCRYVEKIKPEYLITFKSRQDAEAKGYTACKVCGG